MTCDTVHSLLLCWQFVGRLIMWLAVRFATGEDHRGLSVVIFVDVGYLPCAEAEVTHLQEWTVKESSASPQMSSIYQGVQNWVLEACGESQLFVPNPFDRQQNQFRPFVASKSSSKCHTLDCQKIPSVPCLYPEGGPERCCYPSHTLSALFHQQ